MCSDFVYIDFGFCGQPFNVANWVWPWQRKLLYLSKIPWKFFQQLIKKKKVKFITVLYVPCVVYYFQRISMRVLLCRKNIFKGCKKIDYFIWWRVVIVKKINNHCCMSPDSENQMRSNEKPTLGRRTAYRK